MKIENIRNFSIIAHIDHGKSTLADRLLEFTGTINDREKVSQFLDNMELERERGITIKAQTVRLKYNFESKPYILNLIDTPGHVDFSYEVSKSLAACEGALLIVDASQGVEAQTLANVYIASDMNLNIIPVINKIDLPSADIEKTKQEIEEIVGLDANGAILASAKEGIGIKEILDDIVRKIPPPEGDPEAPLKALVFDSWFDSYQGVVALVRIFNGRVKAGDDILLMSSGKSYEVQKVGVYSPHMKVLSQLSAGEVGCIIANIKDSSRFKIGDTVTLASNPTDNPLVGFKEPKPMVFAGIYPIDSDDYQELKDSIEKLKLNDSSFTYEPETSLALGFGFRCGFLGLLHMEIIVERLEREYNLNLITTSPTVLYKIITNKGEVKEALNPAKFPSSKEIPMQEVNYIEEPFIHANIYVPTEYLGKIMTLCIEKRGIQIELKYITKQRVLLVYELPLSEIVLDFYDQLKSLSKGYASFDYDTSGYRQSDMIKLEILVNKEPVDALSVIAHKDKAFMRGRNIVEKLKTLIPRQMFEVVIQAQIGSKIIAREEIKALRKNVLAKCYGGDITRKRKLLEKQKEGKKKMKNIGSVEIPQEAFLSVLKV
ncbi:MAG: translation elongation factor 4 [Deltaproteobacteria bacterium]|nr:translation elongation factor 4 [Deltaproteobacteria bacterium]